MPAENGIIPNSYRRPTSCMDLILNVCHCLLAGLPPATLSLLPGGQLTQLVLTATDLDPLTAQELAGITSLRDLRLPLLNPARRELAPVLASLTRLTRLLLCNPAARVLDSLPASMLVLELVRWHQTTLQLGHLTALQTLQLAGWDSLGNMNQKLLQLAGVAQAYDGDMGPIFNDSDSDGPDDPEEPPMPSGGELDSAAALPTQLQRLLAIGILDAAPLAQVSGLVHLQLTGLPDSYQEALPGLRALTQLTRVELLQRFWSATIVDAASWGPLFQGLPLHVPRLRLQVPVSYPLTVNPARLVRALHPITSLTRLDLSRGRAPRAAAILAAAAAAGGNGVGDGTWQATVDQLASLLPASLVELKLSRLPAVAAESGVAAVGAEWLPLMERIARLPALRSLHVKSMPLGRSIAPLGDARHLTSLALVYCAVDDGDFATAFGPGRAGPVVLQSLKVETIPGDWSGEPKLSAAGMLAGLAGAHMLQHLQVLQLPGHGLTKGQLWPLVSSLPLLTKLEL